MMAASAEPGANYASRELFATKEDGVETASVDARERRGANQVLAALRALRLSLFAKFA
jgi:hypothetical protein